jgi:hypothetical protein
MNVKMLNYIATYRINKAAIDKNRKRENWRSFQVVRIRGNIKDCSRTIKWNKMEWEDVGLTLMEKSWQ